MAFADETSWLYGEGFDSGPSEEYGDWLEDELAAIEAGEVGRDKAYNEGYRQGLTGKPCIDQLDVDYLEGWDDGFEEFRKAGG